VEQGEEEKTDSASKWTKEHLIALQVYLVPIINKTDIVPQAFIPSVDGMTMFEFVVPTKMRIDIKRRFGDGICDPTVNSDFIKDIGLIKSTFPGAPNHQLRVVLQRARALLTKPPGEPVYSAPEKFSDALLRSVLEFIGVNDIELSPFEMR
jgi:hypothetical protein